MAKYLYGYHEERGFADLYVTDVNGNTVWEVHYPSFYESNGEMLEETTIFEDGFMKGADDIEGLEKYLKSISVINRGDELVDRDEDMYDDDADDSGWDYSYEKAFDSEYAAGGTIEAKIKKRLKNAFELPIQIAVYVPSTRDKDIIITKREMEARVDEVERFLANAFGGFSAVKVEGGFESSDKGLIQEDAVRVVAFASKENENGVPFEQSFESLMNQVKDWCYKWSQQSIGVEFENDLFYVDTETKFADGGYMAKGGEVDLSPYKDIQNLNMLYKSGSKWYAWGKKYNVETKGEGYTKKEALQDLDNHLSYVSEDDEFARGGKTYEYETYHNTLSSALNEADKYVESKGLKFTDETYFPDVTMGGISYGQTARLTRGIQREGKKKEDVLIVVIYRMDSGKYELTMYTSYEKGGYMADGGKVPSKKEMLDYLKMYFKHFSELRTIAVEEDGILTLKMLPTLDDEQIEMAYEDAKYELGEILKYENYADGGDIAESNLQMLRSNAKAIKHHAEELEGELNDDTEVEAWVVAKGERAATDLSDITHYLDGKKFYAGGLTAGRWYKDNSGEEFKYIGKNDDTGELIFTDGSKRVNKTLDDFGGRPKENKLFGFFEDGGDLEEGVDLFEDYDEMPASVVETLSKYDLESGDYRELEKALKDLKKYGYTFEYELDGQPYDLRKIGQKGKSEFYAKGGSIKSIEKRVAEVNELIKRGNELGIEVVDEGNTWQAPMKYKPLKYTNGVLYISYEVMDLYKYNREYVQDWEKKSYKIGRYESSWGHQGEEGSAQREALTEIARMYRKPLKSYDTYGYFEDGGEVNKVNPEEIKVKIEQILDKVVPSFYKGVSIHKNIFDTGNNIRIFIAASDYKINGVSGQLPQVVSLSLDLSDMDLHPQVFGGNGGRTIDREKDMSDPNERFFAFKSVRIPFRTPQPNEKAVLDAIKKFAENYKKTLAENREVLLYQDIVDYDKLLAGSQYADGGMISEKEMRETYVKAFGKEFDDKSRKQHPLPLKLAYEVALNKLKEEGKMAKGGVIASSTTIEGIEKLIGDYYYSKNISLKKLDDKDEYEVSNSKGKINGVKVIVKKGRYQFVESDKMAKGGTFAEGGMMAKGGETKKYTDKLIEYLKKNGQLNQGRESIAQDGTKYRYDRYSTKGESANNWIVSLFENAAQENGNRYATEFSYKDIYSIAYDRPKYNNVVNGKISITELVELDKMAKGGTFAAGVKAIEKRLVGTKVNPKYQKEYGKTYDKAEAHEAASKIKGKMRAMELAKKYKKKK